MREEHEKALKAGVRGPILLSPWLVALAALALYGFTLNHWVTFNSLPFAAQLTGWDWHPGPLAWRPVYQYPLFYILTLPLRLLPAAWRPLGLNVFTAVAAALTLAILARSVRLLSQDRTKEQRLREGGEFGLLSVRGAFLPVALAALMLAADLTFWQNSVSGTAEMIDLLVFAFLILCLLEFRVSQSERRLNLFAFVYGMGVSTNWALLGFFPCFLLALIWLRRMAFFNWRFVSRMLGWGALGLLLYGLIPLMGAIHGDGSFWELLHQKLAEQKFILSRVPRYVAVIAGVPTLIPLLFAAINWPSFEAEMNAGAHNITLAMFRVLHIVFLAVSLLMFFDVQLSPSPRSRFGMGVVGPPGFLSFYYLAALSVGYFSGYVLLVFGKDVSFRWGQARGLLRVINQVVVALLWVTAVGLPAMLFYENFPHIRAFNSPALKQFAVEMAQSLPSRPAVVLADDADRLYLTMGASQSLGLPDQYVFVESRALIHPEYFRYLVNRYPALRKNVNPEALTKEISSLSIGEFLSDLSERQAVYYLHPSFGSYFERVCMTPRRLGGDLHPYPTNALATRLLTPEQTAANQAYWHGLEKGSLAALPELAKISDNWAAMNVDAIRVATYYSQILDYWGVELQKTGTDFKLPPLLKDANDQFAEAFLLNSDNVIARVNQQFNAHLRGVPYAAPPISSAEVSSQIASWEAVYNHFGPVDVPDLEIQVGRSFAKPPANAYLQAAHIFQRSLELGPDNPVAELDLAKTYLDLGGTNLADAALAIVKRIPEHSSVDMADLVRIEALAYARKNDFTQADKLLTAGLAKYPKDDIFAGEVAEFYRQLGYGLLRQSRGDPAQEKGADLWFKKSLDTLGAQLRLLNDSTKVTASAQEIPNINLRKAEMQMMLKDYPAAIITLTAMVREDPENPAPRLNRAISELQTNPSRLDAAKSDYQAVEKMIPEPSHRVYYGLAQIAQKENNKPDQIRYEQLYLRYAPTNTLEFTNMAQQLHQLEAR